MTELEIALNELSQPQRRIISLNDVTLEQEELHSEEEGFGNWFYFIAGVYHQQKGFKTPVLAYKAAIEKICTKKR